MTVETIQHAAVRWLDGTITKGRDHGQAYQKREGWKDEVKPACGFITSEGRFVSRQEARRIVFNSKQVIYDDDDYDYGGGLQSEELWFYGQYSYDDEKGYHK